LESPAKAGAFFYSVYRRVPNQAESGGVGQVVMTQHTRCVMASPDPSIRQRRVGALTEEMRARMNRPSPKIVRRRFLIALGHAVHVTWPVLSTILAIQVVSGVLLGFVEGWSVGDALYFTFVTGLTIGYGDIVPRQALGRALAIGVGISGLFLTGLIAGIAVHAMRAALTDRDTG
jgi:hypothetical protein